MRARVIFISLILVVLVAVGGASAGGGHEEQEGVCPAHDSGKIDTPGAGGTLTITAPDGFLISHYCVKAGSIKQGDGPEMYDVDPPAASVTISHSSGKDISHYSVSYVPIQEEEPVMVPVCDPETGEIIEVPEDEAHMYLPVDDPACQEDEPENPEEPTPDAPPVTPETPAGGSSSHFNGSHNSHNSHNELPVTL